MIKAKLKNIYIVRHADCFEIFTGNRQSATKIFPAGEGYLKKTIINLKRKFLNFLGFAIKSVKRRKIFVINTHISQKKKKQGLEQSQGFQKKQQYKTITPICLVSKMITESQHM